MLCAGDEFGRTQGGNNNAYAQDNAITWVDWQSRDRELDDFVAELASRRAQWLAPEAANLVPAADWYDLSGNAMTPDKWDEDQLHGFEVHIPAGPASILLIRADQSARKLTFRLSKQ